MARPSVVVLAVMAALLLAAVVTLSDGSSADDEPYTVVGLVTDAEDNGIFGVNVSISDTSGTHTGYTDDSGEFQIEGITDESCTITFEMSGKTVTSVYSAVMVAKSGSDSYTLTLPSASLSGTTYDITAYPATMSDTFLTAYIMEETSSENVPLEGVEVIIKDAFDNTYTATTAEDGSFTSSIGSLYGLNITVNKEGYTIVPQFFLKSITESEWYRLYLRGSDPSINLTYNMMTPTDADGDVVYSIPETYPILVSQSTGSIYVYVYDDADRPIQGATVTLTSLSDDSKYTKDTDSNGYATITSVTTGEYSMTVSVGGFETVTVESVSVVKGNNTVPDIILTEKSEFTLWGINISHLMMIFGTVFGVILMLFSYSLFNKRRGIKLEE